MLPFARHHTLQKNKLCRKYYTNFVTNVNSYKFALNINLRH